MPHLHGHVRWARQGFGHFTNYESRVTNHLRITRTDAGILGLPDYGAVQDETLVVTARNEDSEDHQVGVREQPAL